MEMSKITLYKVMNNYKFIIIELFGNFSDEC